MGSHVNEISSLAEILFLKINLLCMLAEGSSAKGSPEDKQACGPYIRGSAKISRNVNQPPNSKFVLIIGTWGYLYEYGDSLTACLLCPIKLPILELGLLV